MYGPSEKGRHFDWTVPEKRQIYKRFKKTETKGKRKMDKETLKEMIMPRKFKLL